MAMPPLGRDQPKAYFPAYNQFPDPNGRYRIHSKVARLPERNSSGH